MSRNQPSLKSPLQARFNLRAFLSGRHMKPESYPTFDVSLEWPLIPQLNNQDAITAPFQEDLIVSRPGVHSLCTRLFIEPTVAPTAGDAIRVLVMPPGAQTSFTVIAEVRLFPARSSPYPIIGCISTDAVAAGGTLYGIKPVYIPEGWSLNFNYNANVASAIQIKTEFFQLPSSQPMTTLFNY